MNSSTWLSYVTFIYGLAMVLYIALWVFKSERLKPAATLVLALGAAGNLAGIIWRWIESHQMGYGHAPLSNLYESLIFFALAIAVIYLFVELRYRNHAIGIFATPLVFLTIAYASLNPNISDKIQPLIPALQSNWLIAHVFTCFLGYAGFAIAFGVSLMYLLRRSSDKGEDNLFSRLPERSLLDELTHQMVMFGFLFLTIGIITGAVWADQAWGRYWGWDPKETWSAITWVVYAALLHLRLMYGWRGRPIALMSIFGFAAVLFTYFGVNLLPGLHSYATS